MARPIAIPSPNVDERPAGTPIDMLVLHYTGMESAEAALARLCDPTAKVSAHYVIEESGLVHALVDERRRAWHAGVSFWRGHRDINARSIGIEMVNPGHEFGYRAFPEAQMAALEDLATGILKRHLIPPRNVVGHSDVAPTRKTDPGELFDWKRLAGAGIGLWPSAPIGIDGTGTALLDLYGYDMSDEKAAVMAFQRHFRSARIDGIMDAESTGLIGTLVDLT